jgi:GT2 family glycosyltransferase
VISGGDADLCWRLRDAGWKLEPRPRARVRHRNRATLRALLGQLHRHGRGMAWLEARYPGTFPPPTARELLGRPRMLARDRSLHGLIDVLGLYARDSGRLRGNR